MRNIVSPLDGFQSPFGSVSALSIYAVAGFEPELVADFEAEYYRANRQKTTFDGLLTHSRLSNATMVDSDGVLKWGPHNIYSKSQEYDHSDWVKPVGVTITPNSDVAPDGTTTADTITSTGNQISQNASCLAGSDYTHAIFVKKTSGATYTPCLYLYFSGSTTDIYSVVIDTDTGTPDYVSAVGFSAPLDFGAEDAGDYWLLWVKANSGTNTAINYFFYPNLNKTTGSSSAGSQVIWGSHGYRSDLGGMVNNPDRGDSYVPTTSSARYLPRRGHHVWNGSAWVNEGLLIETEARTNLLTRSAEFNTGWTLNNGAVTANAATAPDGTTTADKNYAASTATGLRQLYQIGKSTTAVPYTWSFFAKAAELDWVKLNAYDGTNRQTYFDLTNGVVGTTASGDDARIVDYGNGWYRCIVTRTPTAAAGLSIEITTGDGVNSPNLTAGDGLYIWGAQFEAGSTPSSYIPTSSATVTRAAETLQISAANMSYSATAMSIQMDGRMTYADTGATELIYYDWRLNSGNYIQANLRTQSTATGEVYQLQAANSIADDVDGRSSQYTPGIDVPFNIASRHGSTYINGAVDGTALTADTTPVALPDLSSTDLSLAYDYMGTIRQFRIWADDLGDTGIEEAST